MHVRGWVGWGRVVAAWLEGWVVGVLACWCECACRGRLEARRWCGWKGGEWVLWCDGVNVRGWVGWGRVGGMVGRVGSGCCGVIV